MTITTVALSKLVPSKANVRRYASDAGIESLAAAISSQGLLQNLNVQRAAKGKFEVIAGGRRLKALQHLLKTGGSIQGVEVTKDYPVAVREGATDDVSATEVSLSENFQRSAMHHADEIEAFGKLNRDENLSPEEIAARFGISHMTVRRRLALASLSPRLLAELREDRLSLQQAEALALSPDHGRQEAAWFEAESWQRNPHHLKSRMADGRLSPGDKIAVFIRDEYIAAGGPVDRDLFAPVEQAYFADKDLAYKLVGEKLEQQRETVAAEGWKWVEVTPDFDYSTSRHYGRVYAVEVPLPDEQQRKLEELEGKRDALGQQLEDRDLDSDMDVTELTEEEAALVTSYHQIESEINALEEEQEVFSVEDKAMAGAVITLDYQGRLQIERGLIHPDDRTAAVTARSAGAAEATSTNQASEPETGTLSAALTEDLTAQRSAALSVELSNRPDAALMTLVYTLALQHFYNSDYGYERNRPESAIQIRRERTPRPSSEIEASPSIIALSKLETDWKSELPKSSRDLWDWCRAATPETLSKLMAALVGLSLNATQQRHERRGKRHEHADRIAEAIDFDMSKHWQADDAFFRRTSKAYMAETILEAAGDGFATVAKNVGKIAKGDAVSATVEAVSGRGWLPTPLRTLGAATVIEDVEDLDEDLSEDEDYDQDEAA